MMGERPAQEPTQFVIWGATGLLAAVLSVAIAFGLWTQLHQMQEGSLLGAAVTALGAGTSLVGFSAPRATTRLFLVVFGVVMIAAFFLGGPAFQTLAP